MIMMPRRLFWCLCSVLLRLSPLAANEGPKTEAHPPGSFRIAGYLPDYRFGNIDLNSTVAKLDDLYLFSLSPQSQLGSKMFALCCLRATHYEQAREAVAHAAAVGRDVRLWVTVGGAGRSFSFVKAPGAMTAALKQLTADQKLQGVDFDCEHFGSHQDYVDYEALITNAAYVLHKESVQISVALHARQTLSKEVYNAVDRINLMSYDMPGATYHADLKLAQESVNALVESGCPVQKIFLGIPAYGRHQLQANEAKSFAELVDVAVAQGATLDELYERNEIGEYMIDSPAAVAAKVRYAQNEGLGGVFFWEVGQDKRSESAPAGMLLSAAASHVAVRATTQTTNVQAPTTQRTAEIYESLKARGEL